MAAQAKLNLKPPPAYETPRIDVELDEIELLERDAALLHQAIRDAVNEVEPKQCSWVMKRDGTTLSNWVYERPDANGNPRMPPAKLLLYLGKKQKSGRLSALLARLWGFAPPVRPDELSVEEENRRLKEQLRAEGSFGAHVLEKALGR
jgi:hypothetical protein